MIRHNHIRRCANPSETSRPHPPALRGRPLRARRSRIIRRISARLPLRAPFAQSFYEQRLRTKYVMTLERTSFDSWEYNGIWYMISGSFFAQSCKVSCLESWATFDRLWATVRLRLDSSHHAALLPRVAQPRFCHSRHGLCKPRTTANSSLAVRAVLPAGSGLPQALLRPPGGFADDGSRPGVCSSGPGLHLRDARMIG